MCSRCGCNPCGHVPPFNVLDQAVQDALASRVVELDGLAADSKESAKEAGISADAAQASAVAASASATNAQTSANTASEILTSVTDASATINAAVEQVEALTETLESEIAKLTTAPFYHMCLAGEQNVVLPAEFSTFSVRSLYIAGVRQDVGYDFTFDKPTQTIRLSNAITADDIEDAGIDGLRMVAVCDNYNSDDATGIATILSSTGGANTVNTSTGKSVQAELDAIKAQLASLNT